MLTIDYDLLGVREGERILDIGCGEGRHIWELVKQRDCLVCGTDLDQTSLIKGRVVFHQLDEEGASKGNWLLTRGSILRLPFKSKTFDRVICSEVLEHVPDDLRGIRELVRVLKDDGVLAVSVPAHLPEAICWRLSKDYHNTPGGHIRIYKASELRSKLHQNMLEIFAERRKHALHSFYWISRCLFGPNNEKAILPSLYHRFLVWDLKTRTKPVRLIDSGLNTFFGKSIVMYARKSHTQRTGG